jgi:IS5 family transposase
MFRVWACVSVRFSSGPTVNARASTRARVGARGRAWVRYRARAMSSATVQLVPLLGYAKEC